MCHIVIPRSSIRYVFYAQNTWIIPWVTRFTYRCVTHFKQGQRVPDEPCKMIIKRNRSVIVNAIAGNVNYNSAVFATMAAVDGFH